jgi:CBS domain containing-hemolysin-like protein
MPIDELSALIGVELPDDEVDTVLGLLAERLGLVPIPGASVAVGGYRLTAEAAEGRRNRISTVLVEPLSPEALEGSPSATTTPASAPESADG